MSPRLARLESGLSPRGRWSLLACGLAILALPTGPQQARSQFGAFHKPPEDGVTSSKANIPLPPMAPPSVEYLPEPMGVEKTILAKLDEIVDLNFQSESLEGIALKLNEMHGIQMVMDKIHLEDESVKTDVKDISLKLSAISLRSGLKLLLKQKNLAFVFEDEVLKVTTMTYALTRRHTRVYPVRDLVGNVDADYQLLSRTIQLCTGGPPDEPWEEMDGAGGSISADPGTGSLVIRVTTHGHEEILKLLRGLRKANLEMTPKQ